MIKLTSVGLVPVFASSVLGVTFAGLAIAQQSSGAERSNELEEIVVTATRRAATVQDIPISVTAISGVEMQDRARRLHRPGTIDSGRLDAIERSRADRI